MDDFPLVQMSRTIYEQEEPLQENIHQAPDNEGIINNYIFSNFITINIKSVFLLEYNRKLKSID